MKGILGCCLLGMTLVACQTKKFDSQIDSERTYKDSNQTIAMPDDLKPLKETYDKMVKDPSEQDENQLLYTIVKLDIKDQEDAAEKIFKYETDAVLAQADLSLNGFSFNELYHFRKDDSSDKEKVLQLLFTRDAGFFCSAYKNEDQTAENEPACRQETEKFLNSMINLSLPTFIVAIDGNSWGAYSEVDLWVQSATDKTVFLRYFFDLIHEI